jgi:urocanate hydratase
MAIQNVIGDSFRGATWVAIHNGGGVGWYDSVMNGDSPTIIIMPINYCSDNDRGEVINGGFGLVLDGTEEAAERLKMMLSWDVLNGVTTIEYH